LEFVSTLNLTVSPRFTLISVANPWMLASPDPTMSHSPDGFPGFEFSHAMALAAAGMQGANGSGDWAAAPVDVVLAAAVAATLAPMLNTSPPPLSIIELTTASPAMIPKRLTGPLANL
jgi:hypothetical protein